MEVAWQRGDGGRVAGDVRAAVPQRRERQPAVPRPGAWGGRKRRRCELRRHGDGSGQTRVSTNPADETEPSFSPDGLSPSFSPDGTAIAFGRRSAGVEPEIYVMRADGSGQTNITHDTFFDSEPKWGPSPPG